MHKSGDYLLGPHFWGLLVITRRKFAALILMDPGHVTQADSDNMELIIQECHENAPTANEWEAVRDHIVQPTIMNFLHFSRRARVDNRSRPNTIGVFMASFLQLRAPPDDVLGCVIDVSIIYAQCMRHESIRNGSTAPAKADNAGSGDVCLLEKKKRKLQSEISGLENKRNQMSKKILAASPGKEGGGGRDKATTRAAFLMSGHQEEYDTLCSAHDVDGLCGQALASILRPKGPRYPNGALKCSGCSLDHPAQNAAEVKSTYGSEFFQGLHDLMNPHVPNVSKTALAKRAKKGNATPK